MSYTRYNPDDEGKPFNYVPEAGTRLPNGEPNTPDYDESDAIREREELARTVKQELGIV